MFRKILSGTERKGCLNSESKCKAISSETSFSEKERRGFRIDKGRKVAYTNKINAGNKRSTENPAGRERAVGESPWREHGKWLGSCPPEGSKGERFPR